MFHTKSLTYGSIEIRTKGNKKYIYTHRRENGRMTTTFVGEYSDELLNVISSNNLKTKEIKKAAGLKQIRKKRSELP